MPRLPVNSFSRSFDGQTYRVFAMSATFYTLRQQLHSGNAYQS
jgi:hypothetical protein